MNKKRFLAVLTVATMLTSLAPMTVFAAAPTSTGKTIGSSSSEGNNATDIFRVVLPTTVNHADGVKGTYDFILDPNDLLSNSSLDGMRGEYDGSSVYFTKEKDKAKVTVTASPSDQLYAEGKTALDEGTATAADLAGITLVTGTGAVDTVTAGTYFVWIPDTAEDKISVGVGKWEELTKDNIADYFTLTADSTDDTKCASYAYAETKPCDTKLYKKSIKTVTPVEAVEYCTLDNNGAITATTLFTDAAGTTPATANALTYTAATVTYTDTSDDATVVNKSTFPVLVTVDVQTKNTTPVPVVYTKTADVETGDKLNFALDITTASTTVGNVTSTGADNAGKASVTYFLNGYAKDGSNYNYKQYQGAVDPNTGGHKYNYLEEVGATWDDVSYALTAACNTTADWTAYNDSLTADNRITTEVVYTIDKSAFDKTAASSDYAYSTTTKAVNVQKAYLEYIDGSFWMGISDAKGFDKNPTDLKLNGVTCENTRTDDGFITVSEAQALKALQSLDGVTTFTFTFTIDSVKYISTYTFAE